MNDQQTALALNEPRNITHREILARLQDRSLVIVDVTPAASYKSGHIPGSVNLPVVDIESRGRQVLPDLHQEIVVYCAGPT